MSTSGVLADRFINFRQLRCILDRPLQPAGVEMVAAYNPSAWISREAAGGENILPASAQEQSTQTTFPPHFWLVLAGFLAVQLTYNHRRVNGFNLVVWLKFQIAGIRLAEFSTFAKTAQKLRFCRSTWIDVAAGYCRAAR